MQSSDADLIETARRGDLASFGVLYERHYRLAVGIARSRLWDAHLAEDAAQEAFAIACQSLGSLQNGARFPEWLGTICRRTASRLAMGQPKHEPFTKDHEPTSDAAQHEMNREVGDALTMLDETAREIVVLHYFSRLTHAEIADVMQLSPQAVHGRLQRARARLAELLKPTATAPNPERNER